MCKEILNIVFLDKYFVRKVLGEDITFLMHIGFYGRILPVFLKHVFRFLAAVRSTPPKIGKNAKFYGNIFRQLFGAVGVCPSRLHRKISETKLLSFHLAFFSVFGGGAQHAAKNRKKNQVFI